jgi:hypothetical protein
VNFLFNLKYNSIKQKSIDSFEFIHLENNKTLPILMSLTSFVNSKRNLISSAYYLSKPMIHSVLFLGRKEKNEKYIENIQQFENLMKFNGSNLRDVFDKFEHLEMEMFLQSYFISHGQAVIII